jgi:hypothetical protein
MTNPFLPTPELARSILRGERENIVWGGTESLTAHEWRRQIPASFFVDINWKWWYGRRFMKRPFVLLRRWRALIQKNRYLA